MGFGRPGIRQKVCDGPLPGPSRTAAALLALVSALVLTGCATQTIVDNLPASMGGLPDSVPKRAEDQGAYPAVHDIPPPRSTRPLTEEEKKRLREELAESRDRAGKQGGVSTSGTARNP
jgi:hypothetical protein